MFLKGVWKFLFVCVFSPNINAQSPPDILDCPSNILHAIAYGETSTIVTWQAPSSSNTFVLLSNSHVPGSIFDLGKTSVRYTFINSMEGESINCYFTVEVKSIDTIAPEVLQCPRGVSATISHTESSVSVNWIEPSATDNTGTDVIITKTHSPGDMFDKGFTVVNYTFADASGNVNSCSFTVTVYLVDNTPPIVVNCPTDITIAAVSHNVYEAVSWTEPSATDETSQNVDLEVYRSHSPGDRFRAGVTNVLYVFADESQNVANCTFQIHLDPTEVPRVSYCPPSRVKIVENDDPEPTIQEQQKPQFLTEGTSLLNEIQTSSLWNRTFVQIQISPNNEIVCSYDIYIFRVDTILPDIVNCQSRTEVMTASLGLKGWLDSVTAPEGDFTASYSPEAIKDYLFPVGETVLAILLEDTAKNARVCSVSVVINPAIQECPRRISGESKTNENSLEVFWPSPSSVPSVPSNTATPSGSVFMLGSTTVQYEFVNGAGMREICEFEVNVKEENPVIVTFCPDDIVKTLPFDSDSVIVTWPLPDADNKLGSDYNVVGVSATHNSGDSFSVGETTVVYVFQDETQQRFKKNCTFAVSVKDTTDPSFEGCPSEVRLSVLAWYGTFRWEEEITSMDNSGKPKISASHISSFQYPLGETDVSLRAVDSSGNVAICSFPVIVSLIVPLPVLILIAVVILLLLIFITSCCCCCRRCCKREKEDYGSQETGGHRGRPSNKEYKNQKAQGDKKSKESSDPPRKSGNNYSSATQMNYLEPSKTTSPPNNAGEYVYVDESKTLGGTTTPPPVPTTPRPGNSNVAYVNDTVDTSLNTFPRKSPKNAGKKTSTVETPRLSEERYLEPADVSPTNAGKKTSTVETPRLSEERYLEPADVSSHEYMYADQLGNPNEYSYAYDHSH